MDRALAWHVIVSTYEAMRPLGRLPALVKQQVPRPESEAFTKSVAYAITDLGERLLSPLFAAHPDLERAIDRRVERDGLLTHPLSDAAGPEATLARHVAITGLLLARDLDELREWLESRGNLAHGEAIGTVIATIESALLRPIYAADPALESELTARQAAWGDVPIG